MAGMWNKVPGKRLATVGEQYNWVVADNARAVFVAPASRETSVRVNLNCSYDALVATFTGRLSKDYLQCPFCASDRLRKDSGMSRCASHQSRLARRQLRISGLVGRVCQNSTRCHNSCRRFSDSRKAVFKPPCAVTEKSRIHAATPLPCTETDTVPEESLTRL